MFLWNLNKIANIHHHINRRHHWFGVTWLKLINLLCDHWNAKMELPPVLKTYEVIAQMKRFYTFPPKFNGRTGWLFLISSQFISTHLNPSCVLSFHLNVSHFNSSPLNTTQFYSTHLILSHFTHTSPKVINLSQHLPTTQIKSFYFKWLKFTEPVSFFLNLSCFSQFVSHFLYLGSQFTLIFDNLSRFYQSISIHPKRSQSVSKISICLKRSQNPSHSLKCSQPPMDLLSKCREPVGLMYLILFLLNIILHFLLSWSLRRAKLWVSWTSCDCTQIGSRFPYLWITSAIKYEKEFEK
jgi:hypothetical protein